MPALRELTSVLGSVEHEIRSSTPFEGIGLVMPWSDGRVWLELRMPVTVSVNLMTPDQMPPILRLPNESGGQQTPLAPHLDPQRALDRSLAIWQLNALVSTPIETHLGPGLLFAAKTDERPFTDADCEQLVALSRRLVQTAREPEPEVAREARLRRLDILSEVLPALGTALDVREIFGQLSAVVKRAVPHDAAVIGLHEDNHQRVRIHALSMPAGVTMPETVENPYPTGLNDGWVFMIHRDLDKHPIEKDRLASQRGLRSAIRVAIWLDGRVSGVVGLSSATPNQYGDDELGVAMRMAECVRLVLSHQRLAEAAGRAEELRERAANLEVLEELLHTLTGVLDIREVFDRVSAIAKRVLPHDAMSVPIILDNPPRLRVHALSGFGDLPASFEAPMPEPRLMTEPWDHLILDFDDQPMYSQSPANRIGMKSVLCLPIRLDGRLHASVNFYARDKGAFSADDVLVGRRITDHVALAFSHRRLVEEAQRTAALQAETASMELLDALLAAETHGEDLDAVFDRIADIAQKVLPHDAIVLPVALADGKHARIYARGDDTAAAFPEIVEVPDAVISQPGWEFELVDDLQEHHAQRFMTAAKRGYRSAMRVPVRLEDRYAGALLFFAAERARYTSKDVMVARRIADRVAVILARDRGAAASRRAEEVIARAAKLESRVRVLTDELDARTGFRRVVGESAAWRQVLLQATRVAATDTTALLLGESGTGKEVVARFLHRASERSKGPFLALNCAALPEHLLEAELFGYERGAFTGAVQSKPGMLEQAAGGTLLLDEVGEMSLPAQAKFLRVLQEREFQRLGGTRVVKSDARIVAATNRDLPKMIAQGRFREDLFYRLNVFAIQLPALRERRDDILPLTDAFVAEIGRGLGRPPSGIARDARSKLVDYHWPGNVRELRNILERAAILCEGGLITAEQIALPTAPRLSSSPAPSAASTSRLDAAPPATAAPTPRPAAAVPTEPAGGLQAMERTLIEQALQGARFNKSKAAKALGLTRAQLYVRMRRHGLE